MCLFNMMNVQAAENQTESFHATVLESESLTYDILDEDKEPFEGMEFSLVFMSLHN